MSQFDEKARRKQLDACHIFRLRALLLDLVDEDPELKKMSGFIRGAGPMDKQKLVDMLVEKERQMAKGKTTKTKGKGRKRIEEDEEETRTKAKKRGRGKADDDEDEDESDPDEDEDEKDEDEDEDEDEPKVKPAKRGRKRPAADDEDDDDEDEKDDEDEDDEKDEDDEDEPKRKPQRGGGADTKLLEDSIKLLLELNEKVDKLIKLVTTSGALIIKAAGGKAKQLKAKFDAILGEGDDAEDER